LALTSFRDSEYAGLLKAVHGAVKDLGYDVQVVKQAELPAYFSVNTRHEAIVLELRGQHLSLRPTEVINLMISQLDSIVDENHLL
ncbi:hypothetical protein, partial [Enterococcus faecium]